MLLDVLHITDSHLAPGCHRQKSLEHLAVDRGGTQESGTIFEPSTFRQLRMLIFSQEIAYSQASVSHHEEAIPIGVVKCKVSQQR